MGKKFTFLFLASFHVAAANSYRSESKVIKKYIYPLTLSFLSGFVWKTVMCNTVKDTRTLKLKQKLAFHQYRFFLSVEENKKVLLCDTNKHKVVKLSFNKYVCIRNNLLVGTVVS